MNNTIDFQTFQTIVPHVLRTKKPVLGRGRHGIGKSEVVYSIAQNIHNILPEQYGKPLPVIERRASQMSEGDLLGLPDKEDGATVWNPPDWLKTACEKPVVLFFDEVDRAILEVRQGLFELTDSRKLSGWNLHPDTLIIAMVNGGEHGSQYQVSEMDPAELDRWTVFDLEPSVADWLGWAKTNVDGSIWDFINKNHGHLEHKKTYEPNKVYPSRRSWVRFNQALVGSGLLTKVFNSDGTPDTSALLTVYHLASAYVGTEAAVAYREFIKSYDNQVSVNDIIKKGKIQKTSSWTMAEHSAFAEKVKNELDEEYVKKMTETHTENLLRYMYTLPSEVFMVYISFLSNKHAHYCMGLYKMTVDGDKRLANYIRKYTIDVKKN